MIPAGVSCTFNVMQGNHDQPVGRCQPETVEAMIASRVL